MFPILANLISRYPRWILAIWLVLVAAAFPLAGRVAEVFTAQATLGEASVAVQVATVLADQFEGEGETTVVLVTNGENHKVGDPAFDKPYTAVIARLRALDGVVSVQDQSPSQALTLIAPDNRFTVALIGLDTTRSARETTREIREQLASAEGLSFDLAGGPATQSELEAVSERDVRRAELFGLPLSLIVLVVAFGALTASGLPIVVALASITLSFALLFLLGQWLEFAVFTQSIVTMLGLATGIDYALLMVNRFREELRSDPAQPRQAARRTALTAGKAVAFSGVTVIVALAALLVPPLPFIRSIGLGTLIVMAMSVAVSVTALPAALALLGERVNSLKITRREPGLRSRVYWAKRARSVLRHPWPVALASLLILVLLSVPAFTMQLADPGVRGVTASTETGRAFAALTELGLEGLLKPFDVLVDLDERGFYHPSSLRAVAQFERELGGLNGVSKVYSALSPTAIPKLMLYQYYATPETALASDFAELVRLTVSGDGRYALVKVFPQGNVGPRAGQTLNENIAALAGQLELNVQIGGTFVAGAEWTRVLYSSFPLAVALVYLATFILLGLAFHSILVPIKAILLNSLTVTAAFGVVTLLFQYGLGTRLLGLGETLGFVDNSAPLFIFAIVFGLSMDYEVFLMARLFEAHRRGLNDRDAVVQALSATGGVITSAALIMLIVFTVFMFSDVVLVKTLGIGLGVAIFLDATLVRVALVPAVMTLAERWNWWLPGPLERLAKRLDLGHD